MSAPAGRFQTLGEQERERMGELLALLTEAPIPSNGAFRQGVQERFASLAELQLLIGAHNANNIDQIRLMVRDLLETQQASHQAQLLALQQRQDAESLRLDALGVRLDDLAESQKGLRVVVDQVPVQVSRMILIAFALLLALVVLSVGMVL